MTEKEYIERTRVFVQKSLKGAETGHDWFHILRVYTNTLLIAKKEPVNHLVVCLGALLHDIADSKFHDGNENLGPELTRNFLNSLGLDEITIDHVVNIVQHISFKNSLSESSKKFNSIELQVVQDADRLDAIGAIGIARAFNYGGFKNRALYNPEVLPDLKMTKDSYKKSESPTINHFYEKLLLLKDKMNTKTGRILAEERHAFMLQFLDQFNKEWDGTN